ncbi:MAG: N-acetylmuramoyl-L-alanine amidase [Acutalibacter sp.]|nr:N-acetylmuramoyl-L-alanine amidase [Acutalibacter sp.]
MGKKLVFLLLFCASLSMFVVQTVQALGIVQFHADLFEKRGTVVLDAGHGGEDGGAVGVNGELEKDINLSIALELEKFLKQNNFEVVMIRSGDYSVGDQSLSTVSERKRSDTRARLRTVEETGDCILLSIHQNHFSQSKYDGAQVFYSENREESAVLAEAIRQSIVSSLQTENHRENKPAGNSIYLLHNCQVPAVLVECGFLSNPAEAEKLTQEGYQKAMATAIYNGLIDYLQEIRESSQNSSSYSNS